MTDIISYEHVIKRFPWIIKPGLDAIISPDSDGLLCGLFMSHFLGWKVRGFYDGKIMVVNREVQPKNCVFMDMEIFRKGIRSVGQHMVMYNKNRLPPNWSNFDDCISINNLRGHDGYHDFSQKYPFGTIHFLIGAVGSVTKVDISKDAISPLLFTDGTWMNLLGYTENSLSWLKYLRADEPDTPLNKVFLNKHYSLHELMLTMNDFLRQRDKISIPRERGDRLTITIRGGEGLPHNLEIEEEDFYLISVDAHRRAELFLTLLSKYTGWQYKSADWNWAGWRLYQLTKSDFSRHGKRLSNTTFDEFIATNPLSFAKTSTQNIEYTIEHPHKISD